MIVRVTRRNDSCRRLDSRWTRMPADRETRLARRWDRLDQPRTSGSRFRGRCAADPQCCWPAEAFAVSLAALGRQILEKLCLLASTSQAWQQKKAARSIHPG